MHAAQVRTSRRRAGSTDNCLYTPTCDREEEVDENSDIDLSDYYSDSGYPTRPRPRLVLWTNASSSSSRRSTSSVVQVKNSDSNSNNKPTSSAKQRKLPPTGFPTKSRKVPVIYPLTSTSNSVETNNATAKTKSKAFSKLRSLRNNRVIPVSSPERQRPPSSLATTSICANGNANGQSPALRSNNEHYPKQLRSVSLPNNSPGCNADIMAAQTKLKKAKKVGRALSFSLGSSDRKKRARSIFGRSSGGDLLTKSEPPPQVVTHSPVLVGRKAGRVGGGTATIYEEDKASISSAEEQDDDDDGSMSYLHGNKFGSCRELTSVGCDTTDSKLRPLSNTKHKRPSLPSFTKLVFGPRQEQYDPNPLLEEDSSSLTDLHPSRQPSENITSSLSTQGATNRRRKLSDPGSASSTPEGGNSPTSERNTMREERRGGGSVSRSRPVRKGFTFSVGGTNVSPDWKEMRHHIVRFLLETEQSYVQSLKTIIKVYLEPLKKPQAFGMIESSLVHDIFYQIPEICSLHERFLQQIIQRTERWHPLQKIGDVFVNTFSKCHLMNIYTMFIHNFMRAKAAIEIAKQARPVFAKFLERSKASTGKLSLDDLLIKPVQRIPRYLLFIKDLLKHTTASHPDHAPLKQALDELTGLAERVNESEREMARMEQQKELLTSVDGLALFVRPESELVRYDLVTEVQGSANKRDRFLILFNDVLVCASTKRKSTGLRRSSLLNLNTLQPDTFRYKIKWSTPIKHLSMGEVQAPMVERKKKNTLEKMIENLTKDEATLMQLLETSNTLRQPHQSLTCVLKDMLSEVKDNLSIKRTELDNLPLLHSRVDLMSYNSLPPTQYSIIFPNQRIRNLWEEDFLRVKQSMCPPPLLDQLSSPTSPQLSSEDGEFEFLHPLHVQSGRRGMKLTCAGIADLPGDISSPHIVWVACCDDYGGQVCLLDLHTNTRPHMVANYTISDSKIVCISAVPLGESPECNDVMPQENTTNIELDSPNRIRDVPLENYTAERVDVGQQDTIHPELNNKTTLSMPRDIRGSLVASFSSTTSSSSNNSTPTISRSSSITSTHSDVPCIEPITLPHDVTGVNSELLNSVPSNNSQGIEFKGHGDVTLTSPRKRNGFHRVCSNSAPDLLKVIAESSPTEEETYRRGGERGATSLSPPPPVESKFWSPMTVCPPPLVEGDENEGTSETRGTSMWLGTEGGQILVYPPGSNLRSRINRITIQLSSSIYCIRYYKQRVYVGLGDGTIAVFDPQHPTTGHTHLIRVSSAPIVACISSGGRLLVASLSSLYYINTVTMEATPVLSLPSSQFIQYVICEEKDEERVWLSVRDQPLIHQYHIPTLSLITSVDCSKKLKDILRGFTPVIRQNKTLSLRITSLLLSDHHLLIGTSTGITLTLPLPVTSPKAQLSHLPHGHIDSVSFLCQLHCHNSILILSGGTGYENLTTSSTAYKITDSASCLLLWRPITKQDSPD